MPLDQAALRADVLHERRARRHAIIGPEEHQAALVTARHFDHLRQQLRAKPLPAPGREDQHIALDQMLIALAATEGRVAEADDFAIRGARQPGFVLHE